jgi:hypothetical protein
MMRTRPHVLHLAVLVSCLGGCRPPSQPQGEAMGYASEPAGAQAAAAAPSDERALHRYVITSLMNAGYRCNEDTPTQCMTDADAWQVTVSTRVEPGQWLVMFDSFVNRTVSTPCHTWKSQLAAATSREAWFTADCNDTNAQFRLNTTLIYSEQLDVSAWMQQHRESRYSAYTQLDSAGAIQL